MINLGEKKKCSPWMKPSSCKGRERASGNFKGENITFEKHPFREKTEKQWCDNLGGGGILRDAWMKKKAKVHSRGPNPTGGGIYQSQRKKKKNPPKSFRGKKADL